MPQPKRKSSPTRAPSDWAVVNVDDPVVRAHSGGIAATRVGFSPFGSTTDGFSVDGDWIVRRTGTSTERLVPVSAVELAGRHMLGNVVAAVATASVAGIGTHAMRAALQGFHGLEHVMEPSGRIGEVRFVNDSKATNIEAARRSIESFDGGWWCSWAATSRAVTSAICVRSLRHEGERWWRWERRLRSCDRRSLMRFRSSRRRR